MKDNKYIERIITYINKINSYMEVVNSFEEFSENSEKVDAVILNLEQIGETARKITEDTKMEYPNIKWRKISGLRNIISHEYEGIDIKIIYITATINISQLLRQLK